MLTDKERMELLNLRKRVQMQREEISKLQNRYAELRARCYPDAEKYFDNKQYGLLTIVTADRVKHDKSM